MLTPTSDAKAHLLIAIYNKLTLQRKRGMRCKDDGNVASCLGKKNVIIAWCG